MEDFRELGSAAVELGPLGRRRRARHDNLITPECIVAAGQLVQRGAIFDLGIPFDGKRPAARRGPHQPGPADVGDRRRAGVPGRVPLRRRLHVHAAAGGVAVGRAGPRVLRRPAVQRLPVERRRARTARKHCSIDKMAKGIVGRGVLLDIARLEGRRLAAAGEVITPEDLDAAAERQGVEVRSRRHPVASAPAGARSSSSEGEPRVHGRRAGPRPGMLRVAARARGRRGRARTTGRSRCCPARIDGRGAAVHMVLIRDMGMTLGEILDFEELADRLRGRRRLRVLLTAPPIKFTNARRLADQPAGHQVAVGVSPRLRRWTRPGADSGDDVRDEPSSAGEGGRPHQPAPEQLLAHFAVVVARQRSRRTPRGWAGTTRSCPGR